MDEDHQKSERGAPWGRLAEAIAAGPDPLAFRACAAALLRFEPAEREEAFAHARAALESWSDADRTAPWTWTAALASGVAEPILALARELWLFSHAQGSCLFSLAQLDEGALHEIRAVHSMGSLRDPSGSGLKAPTVGQFLAGNPERFPGLQRVSERYASFKAPAPLSSCLWFREATDLDVESVEEILGDEPVTEARALRRLSFEYTDLEGSLRALGRHRLPGLRALHLRQRFPRISGEQDLSQAPLLRQIDELSLEEVPTIAVRALFGSGQLLLRDLRLQGHWGRRYSRVDPEQVVIGPEDLGLMLRSGALARLERFEVRGEPLGDQIIELIAATEPGLLRRLVLEGVGLTDEGARRLAALPHLPHLEHLSLLGNELSAQGFSAIVAALSGGSLRELMVGDRASTPYYANTDARSDGDAFAEAVGQVEWPALQRLIFTRLALSPRGCATLAEAPGVGALLHLDLSHDALGPEGLRELLTGGLVRRLRSLCLDDCALDDESAALLARAPFEQLRDLSLSYNSIGPQGTTQLAETAHLKTLFRLSLHDNFVGNAGMIALARSPHLGQLVELDIQQDCWNDRRQTLGAEAARAVADSRTLSSLDTFRGGITDGYHGGCWALPFDAAGMKILAGSTALRTPALRGLLVVEAGPDGENHECLISDEELSQAPAQGNSFYLYDFRQRERSR